jgi:tetratricopeptide (TPR) repeat protein
LNRLLLTLVLVSPVFLGAQQSTQTRTDSVTVSAGIPKEQLAAEQQLNDIMSKAKAALAAGKNDDALRNYKAAAAMVRQQPMLADKKSFILPEAADGIAAAGAPAEAIPIFEESLKLHCEPQHNDLLSCAGDQQALGFCKLATGDASGALSEFRSASATYEKAGAGQFIQLKRAETEIWIGVTLFRLGNRSEAETVLQASIPHLAEIKNDDSLLPGIRDKAADDLAQAQAMLSRIRSAP